MSKRVALLGAIAALTIWNPSTSVAQSWGGSQGCCGITVTVAGIPGPYPYYPRPCCRPYYPRPIACCRPYYPRPVWCCNRPYPYYSSYPYYGRPPYYYGDNFAPYAYNWNRYDVGYNGAGYGYGSDEY
jgi:hypothetical protein